MRAVSRFGWSAMMGVLKADHHLKFEPKRAHQTRTAPLAAIALAVLLIAGVTWQAGGFTGAAMAQTNSGDSAGAADQAGANQGDGGYDDRASLIEPGQLVVTGFSGTLALGARSGAGAGAGSGRANADHTYIDPDGASLRVMDVSGPQSASDAARGGAAEVYAVTAREIGQVFGLALDDAADETSGAPIPNIYATATSVYGLHLVGPDQDGDGWPDRRSEGGADASWMEGLFGTGSGGGPGTVWKINGVTGEPTIFADLSDGDTPNGGAGLGNIAFDTRTRQFFVSDLDSGLIHRLNNDGEVIDVFDHGVDGRTSDGQDAVEDEPGRGGLGTSDFRTDDPDSWGFTPTERRVWGLSVFDDRLYYAVAEGPSIWSVELTEDGGFGAAQREFNLPRGSVGAEISDIAFTQSGTMVLAQRPGVTGAGDFLRPMADQPADVMRFERQDDGSWQRQPDSYAIGMRGANRNASGGVALGYGRSDDGGLDYGTCEAVLWATGDGLFEPAVPQMRSARLSGGPGRGMVDGLQGVDIENVRPGNVPPVDASFIDYDGDLSAREARGLIGDVEIPYQCADSASPDNNGDEDVWRPQNPIPAYLPESNQPDAPGYDLSLEKRTLGACTVGGACWWDIIVTNLGEQSFQGPLIISDRPDPGSFPLIDTGSSGWNCSQSGGYIGCRRPAVHLAPGRSTTLRLGFRVTGGSDGERVQNCSTVRWLGGDPEEELVRAVQLELTRLGYEPGGVDGLAGEGTSRAVEDYQRDMELQETGEVDEDLVTALFGPGAFATGDDDPGNDEACAETILRDPAPVIAAREPRPAVIEYVDEDFYEAPPVVYVQPPRPSLSLELNFWRPYCEPGFDLYRGRCERICPAGFVSDGRRCRAVCYPGEVWRNGRCVATWSGRECRGGRFDGYRCECPRGMERASLGGRRFQCLPIRRGDICEGGRFNGRFCECPRGASPRRVGPGRFVCVGRFIVPEREAVRCDGGRVLGNSCVCPAGTRLTQFGRGRFKCERGVVVRPRGEGITCVGGRIADRRCNCPQGTRLVRQGGRQFACLAPATVRPNLVRPNPVKPVSCIGGQNVGGNCLCPRGTTTVRAKGNRIRCVPRAVTGNQPIPRTGNQPRSQNEPASAGALICESGRFDGNRCVCNRNEVLRKVGARKFRCEPSRGAVLPGAGAGAGAGGAQGATQGQITCVGGKLSGRRCECPAGQQAVRLGARAFRCQARIVPGVKPIAPTQPARLVCNGGNVVGNRCVCVRGDRLTKVGPNLFSCVARAPVVKQPGVKPPVVKDPNRQQPRLRDTPRNAQPTVVPQPRVNPNNQQQLRLQQQKANQERLKQQRLKQQQLQQQRAKQPPLQPKAVQPAAKPPATVACRGGRVVGKRCVCPNDKQLSGGVCIRP